MALSKIDPAGLDIGQIGGRRNLIINGSAIVDQRNSGAAKTSAGYVADRWYLQDIGIEELVFSADQDTTTPDNFSKSLRVQITTAESAVATNDLFRWIYKVEAQDLQRLNYGSSAAQSFTLSFYVRSSLTGTYALNFYTPDSDRNITKTYTINTADTWERKTITVEGDTAGSGIANDNGEGLQINWILMAGSDYTSVDSTSWGTNADNRRAYNHTAEFGTSTSHTFYLTGVQLEVGSVATPFEHRSYGEELALCSRYFQSPITTSTSRTYAIGGRSDGTTGTVFLWPLATVMRAQPSVSQTGTGWRAFLYNTSAGSTESPSVLNYSTNAPFLSLTVGGFSGFTDNRSLNMCPDSLTKLSFDAEL